MRRPTCWPAGSPPYPPDRGAWSSALIDSFFDGERVAYGVLAVVVGVIAGWGALTLTDSKETEEAH